MNTSQKFLELFSSSKPIIGMIHIQALPGTPYNKFTSKEIIEKAIAEAIVYKEYGIDSIMIENMHDIPYLKKNVGSEITSLMSIVGYEIKSRTKLPVGIQILAGANKDAVAVANSAGLDYVRAEGFVFAHIADEGIIESDAGELLRYRKQIGAENIFILSDIKKKHSSHTITNDISIAETAHAAEFFGSDGLVVTGCSTGVEPKITELEEVKNKCSLPLIVGSGITAENIKTYKNKADAFIIGSYFKKDGNWKNDVDSERVKSLLNKIH